MGDALYRVWFELDPPLPRWYWALVTRRLSWPTEKKWLGKAEDGVRQTAAQKGAQLIGDPIGEAVERGGRIVVRASAIATAPFDPDAPVDNAPEGVDGC